MRSTAGLVLAIAVVGLIDGTAGYETGRHRLPAYAMVAIFVAVFAVLMTILGVAYRRRHRRLHR